MNKCYQYFKIKKERQEWLGEKYFRVANDSDSVIEVCRLAGEMKRGRPNCIGVFFITRQSFASNIFMYVDCCTKKQYDNAFETVFKFLK